MLTSEGKKQIILLSIFPALATVFLILRLARKRNPIGPDDWLLCFALLLLYQQAIGCFLCESTQYRTDPVLKLTKRLGAIKGGEGKHMKDLNQDEMTWLLKVN